MFPETGKHQDSRENKTNCFPRDHTLTVYCLLVVDLMNIEYLKFLELRHEAV